MTTNSPVAPASKAQEDYPRIFRQTIICIPAPSCGDECRAERLDEELARRAVFERAVRALERQRELARRQGLAPYD